MAEPYVRIPYVYSDQYDLAIAALVASREPVDVDPVVPLDHVVTRPRGAVAVTA
jgi:hypothetical protein